MKTLSSQLEVLCNLDTESPHIKNIESEIDNFLKSELEKYGLNTTTSAYIDYSFNSGDNNADCYVQFGNIGTYRENSIGFDLTLGYTKDGAITYTDLDVIASGNIEHNNINELLAIPDNFTERIENCIAIVEEFMDFIPTLDI